MKAICGSACGLAILGLAFLLSWHNGFVRADSSTLPIQFGSELGSPIAWPDGAPASIGAPMAYAPGGRYLAFSIENHDVGVLDFQDQRVWSLRGTLAEDRHSYQSPVWVSDDELLVMEYWFDADQMAQSAEYDSEAAGPPAAEMLVPWRSYRTIDVSNQATVAFEEIGRTMFPAYVAVKNDAMWLAVAASDAEGRMPIRQYFPATKTWGREVLAGDATIPSGYVGGMLLRGSAYPWLCRMAAHLPGASSVQIEVVNGDTGEVFVLADVPTPAYGSLVVTSDGKWAIGATVGQNGPQTYFVDTSSGQVHCVPGEAWVPYAYSEARGAVAARVIRSDDEGLPEFYEVPLAQLVARMR